MTMENLILSSYGSDFMSIMEFDNIFGEIKPNIKPYGNLLIDLKGVNNVSPSFMTRLINKLYEELNLVSINITNGNSRLETTFKFAQHSIAFKANN